MTSKARAITKKQPKLFNQSFKVKTVPLIIYGLRGGHTHTHTHTQHTRFGGMKVISRKQGAGWRMRGTMQVHQYLYLSTLSTYWEYL